jgi:hypothetical protein
MADLFTQWYEGVMAGISAPVNATTQNAMWAWSSAESRPYLVTHIDNPLDTTQWEPGAVAWNTFGNGEHVWIYPTIQEGIDATVTTLLNGHYPTIVSHLRNSVPRSQWGDACGELSTWGTGCGWLNADYGAAPGALTGGTEVLEATDPIVQQWNADLGRLMTDLNAVRTDVTDLYFALGLPAANPADPTTSKSAVLEDIRSRIAALTAPAAFDTTALTNALVTALVPIIKADAVGLTQAQANQLTQIVADAHTAAGVAPDVSAIRVRVEKDLAS